jgi:transposase-like protein
MYLYRAVDSKGSTIDFYLSKTRDQKAAKRFFKKALRSFHVSKPRVITVDKNPAYPTAVLNGYFCHSICFRCIENTEIKSTFCCIF